MSPLRQATPELSTILSRFDGELTAEVLSEWISQFEPNERAGMLKLAAAFHYYSSRRVHSLVETLHRKVHGTKPPQVDIRKIWFVPVGYVARSGGAIALFYKKQNNLNTGVFVMPEKLTSHHFRNDSMIVFLDDFIGTGHQASAFWKNQFQPLHSHRTAGKLIFAAIVGYSKGIDYVHRNTGFEVIVGEELAETSRAFDVNSKLFANDEERREAERIARKYGELIYPNHPLGYLNAQALVAFFYSTPNNTLPIFWSTRELWTPLLSRARALPDQPLYPDLKHHTKTSKDTASLVSSLADTSNLARIPDSMTEALIKEFKTLLNASAVGLALTELGIMDSALPGVLGFVDSMKHRKHEQKPVLSSLLLVPDSDTIYGRPFAQAKDLRLEAANKATHQMAMLVDGYDGALVCRRDGYVIGNYLFDTAPPVTDRYAPERYQRAAFSSQSNRGLLFLFSGDGKVSLFYRGQRILVHRDNTWHITAIDDEQIRILRFAHYLDDNVLENALAAAWSLTDMGAGALITLGDADSVEQYCDPAKENGIALSDMELGATPNSALLPVMREDGATIIDSSGRVIRGMSFIRPPADVVAAEELGKGVRHSTAAKITKITNALAIAVSVDGIITVYSKGERVFRRVG